MMKKRLEEMSLEELWRLFPVILKEYDPAYPVWYEEERSRILKIVGKENIFRISHIGSTAVAFKQAYRGYPAGIDGRGLRGLGLGTTENRMDSDVGKSGSAQTRFQ